MVASGGRTRARLVDYNRFPMHQQKLTEHAMTPDEFQSTGTS